MHAPGWIFIFMWFHTDLLQTYTQEVLEAQHDATCQINMGMVNFTMMQYGIQKYY